ncbi:micrococcal nuclease [Methanobacterium oryzae]
MKWKKLILVLILMISIIGIAGCSNDNGPISSYNGSTSQNGLNNTSKTSDTANYEASGYCNYVVDGDTIDVEGIGRIRFVGVNTPERGQAGYSEAKDFVKDLCLSKTVYLDIDDAKHYDKYGRTLAVIYVDNININAELLKRGYAEVMYIPPSEFDPYSWAGTTNSLTVSKSTSSNNNQASAGYYIGNRNSMKFHLPSCSSVAKMNEKNKVRLNSRQEAIKLGYVPCLNCDP